MFNCLAKYLDNRVAGVSVAACIGRPLKFPSLWFLGKQYTGHGIGSLQILTLRLLYMYIFGFIFVRNFIKARLKSLLRMCQKYKQMCAHLF
jgi:hypothetical protein